MEPIYWYVIAYVIGTGFGYFAGRKIGVANGVLVTITMLIENGFLKTRQDENGDIDLIKLTFEERLDDTTTTENN